MYIREYADASGAVAVELAGQSRRQPATSHFFFDYLGSACGFVRVLGLHTTFSAPTLPAAIWRFPAGFRASDGSQLGLRSHGAPSVLVYGQLEVRRGALDATKSELLTWGM